MVILSEKKVLQKRSHIGDLCLSLPQEFVNNVSPLFMIMIKK